MRKKKNKHGGKRKGAGRKSEYGEATVTLSFRIPESMKDEIKELVKSAVAKKFKKLS